MRRLLRVSRRFLVVRLAMLALLVSIAMPPVSTSAQYYDVHSNVPFDQLTGLQFAGQRMYQGEFEQTVLTIYVEVALFDTEANATAGLSALNAYYLDAYANTASPIAFEPVDPPAEAPTVLTWQGFLDIGDGPYAEASLAQVQDGVTVFTAFVVNYAYETNPEELAVDVTGAMLGAILANPAPMATPAAINPASVMERLPLVTDEVPASYGMTYVEDTEWFVHENAEPTIPDEGTTDPGDLLYGNPEGLVTAVSREYAGSGEDLLEAFIEITEFDGEEHAATGYKSVETALAGVFEGPDVTFEGAEADTTATTARAWVGERFDDGAPVAVIIAQSGNYVISVLVASNDADVVLALAEDIAQVTIDADAGGGDAQFDDSGASTGGLWDKLPAAGDVVLQGMQPTSDETLYP